MAMMAITTSNSISVNPFEYGYFVFILKKQSRKATLMPKCGKPFFLPLARRQKRKSGARFPGIPFSGLGSGFPVGTRTSRIFADLQDHLLILMICVHLRPVPAARAWPSVVNIYGVSVFAAASWSAVLCTALYNAVKSVSPFQSGRDGRTPRRLGALGQPLTRWNVGA
jgi:hypothetical protein